MPTGASDQIPLDKSWECHMNEGWGIRDKTTDWLRGFDFVLEELQGPLNIKHTSWQGSGFRAFPSFCPQSASSPVGHGRCLGGARVGVDISLGLQPI